MDSHTLRLMLGKVITKLAEKAEFTTEDARAIAELAHAHSMSVRADTEAAKAGTPSQ